MTDYTRHVLTYLQNEYGLKIGTDDVQHGSNHRYLEFDYASKRHRVTLQRDSVADHGTVKMKLRDIRRELGPPPKHPENQKRTMEEMMPAFNPIPLVQRKEASARGTVSNYETNGCLSFMFPPEIVNCLDQSARYKVTRTGDDSWEITPGGKCSVRKILNSDIWKIVVGAKSGLAGDMGYFNRYPADYVAANGHLLVSVVERKSLSSRKKKKEALTPKIHGQPIWIDPPTTPAQSRATVETSSLDRMTALLLELRAIEKGPCRLVKTKEGKWRFSIQLEDE